MTELIVCKDCLGGPVIKAGFASNGKQMYECLECGRRFCDPEKALRERFSDQVRHYVLLQFYFGRSLRVVSEDLSKVLGVNLSYGGVRLLLKRYPLIRCERSCSHGYVLVYGDHGWLDIMNYASVDTFGNHQTGNEGLVDRLLHEETSKWAGANDD